MGENEDHKVKKPKTSQELLYVDPEESKDRPFLIKNTQKPPISKVSPSPLLARVQAFLPDLKSANEVLEKKIAEEGREKVDIEHVEEDQEQYVQMQLAIAQDSEEGSSEESDSDSSEDEDSDDEEEEEVQIRESNESRMNLQ